MAHWSPNDAIFLRPDQYIVLVRFQLGPDGMLSAPPQVVSTGSGPLYQAAAEAAKRGILLSQPFDMLSPSIYDGGKDIEINFDPRGGPGEGGVVQQLRERLLDALRRKQTGR